MLLIQKNTSNTKVIMTLSERVTIDPVAFLLRVVNDFTGEEKVLSITDTSPSTSRYNQFTIIDNPTEDAYNATADFLIGFHTYYAYQMTPASPESLNYNNGLLLEQGKLKVVTTPTTVSEYSPLNTLTDGSAYSPTNTL